MESDLLERALERRGNGMRFKTDSWVGGGRRGSVAEGIGEFGFPYF